MGRFGIPEGGTKRGMNPMRVTHANKANGRCSRME